MGGGAACVGCVTRLTTSTILAWREERSRAHSSRSRRSSFGEDIAGGAIGGEEEGRFEVICYAKGVGVFVVYNGVIVFGKW